MRIIIWHLSSNVIKNIIPSLKKFRNTVKILGVITNKKSKFETFNNKKILILRKPDFVFISSITGKHYEDIKFCLNNNLNVIVEKPLADSLDKVRELIKLAKRKKLKLFDAVMFQYHPQFTDLKRILLSKQNGSLMHGNIIFVFPHLNKKNFRYKKRLGGGSFLDTAIYIYYFIFLVYGKNIFLKSINFDKIKNGVDVCCLFIFGFKDNSKSLIIAKCGFGFNYNNRLDFIFERKTIRSELIFTKPKKLTASISTFDGHIKKDYKNYKKSLNSFENMFEHFFSKKIDMKKYYETVLSIYKFYFGSLKK